MRELAEERSRFNSPWRNILLPQEAGPLTTGAGSGGIVGKESLRLKHCRKRGSYLRVMPSLPTGQIEELHAKTGQLTVEWNY